MHYELYLPFPPTVNNYYKKSKAGGRYISEKGRLFRALVEEAVVEQLPFVHIDERVLVEAVIFPPDRRKRDIANYEKALSDSLTEAGLWEDDELIDQYFMYRGVVVKGGQVFIRITEAGPLISDPGMLPVN